MEALINSIRQIGIRIVARSHCTGDLAIRMFAEENGDDFIPTGAGSVITIDG
jgi:metal-dependent hydrolase (beta-lactamase superfamily II)